MKPEPSQKADLIGRSIVDELFDLAILDPAMGSGHFLVEVVDYTTDRTLEFLSAFTWHPVVAHLESMRQTILQEMNEQGVTIDPDRLTDVNLLKRHVLKRCVYGVDLNPMAVELAKVSLWLDCFTLGAPLSFLDHHLRCGNSLIGATVEEVRSVIDQDQLTLFGSRFAGLVLASDLMRHVGELSDITTAQLRESQAEYQKASDALLPYKRILDIYTSQWFGNGPREGRTISESVSFLQAAEHEGYISALGDSERYEATAALSPADRLVVETTEASASQQNFLHWELEFPEVFLRRPGAQKQQPGFTAVVGNPPYDVLAQKELQRDLSETSAFLRAQALYGPSHRGKNNFYKLFICRAVSLLTADGGLSFIVPMALLGDDQAAGVRRHLLDDVGIREVHVFPQKDDPKNRVFPEAKLSTTVFIPGSGVST